MINSISSGIVGVVKAGHRQRFILSGIALVVVAVVAIAYLTFGALRVDPFAKTYQVRIELPDSGGLLENVDVAIRGVKVGRVGTLSLTRNGVDATVHIDSKFKIPVASPVRVSGLSAAGEQFIDFEPASDEGPFLSDGSVVPLTQTSTPVPLYQLLTNANGVLAQSDPEKLEIIKRELSLSNEGPQKLTDIVDGGTFMLSTLDSVLPETVSLLKTSRVALTMLSDVSPGMESAAGDISELMTGVTKMDGGYRQLVDQTPGLLSSIDALFDDNSDTMVGLLGNLASVSQLMYVRVPALNALFPSFRGSALEAIGTAFHDNGVWVTADIYPRYTCDYGTPRRPPSAADYPEPFLYTYCRDTDPQVLVRGAKNAPRPAGDDTAGPPPGADLAQTADPTPRGRYTIPTPYGGPVLPIEPPR
ncbi:putative MCE family protein [Mycolicibacterium cyprinidarum]|uniref:MCE family protein n=1 Tax=Mycolicibacterium cyprinidarum TaxID=2860311 RepID=A0ABQ4VD59_9MYCO|nr:putative MCE family protein [Mycolicibacterium sp. NGTWSNA01]GJF19221.1 putative MCE family protein [Mycolicibacterium sp. NGTWS0302]GJF19671.1 putative MCE family protein [Mycolicibacterium sp. NGTWS1803]